MGTIDPPAEEALFKKTASPEEPSIPSAENAFVKATALLKESPTPPAESALVKAAASTEEPSISPAEGALAKTTASPKEPSIPPGKNKASKRNGFILVEHAAKSIQLMDIPCNGPKPVMSAWQIHRMAREQLKREWRGKIMFVSGWKNTKKYVLPYSCLKALGIQHSWMAGLIWIDKKTLQVIIQEGHITEAKTRISRSLHLFVDKKFDWHASMNGMSTRCLLDTRREISWRLERPRKDPAAALKLPEDQRDQITAILLGRCQKQQQEQMLLQEQQLARHAEQHSSLQGKEIAQGEASPTIKIATFNADGLNRKVEKIVNYMKANDIDVTFVCETKLSPTRFEQHRQHGFIQFITNFISPSGVAIYGVAVIVNPKHLTPEGACNGLVFHKGSLGPTAFFTFRGISFGGMYLPFAQSDDEVLSLMEFPEEAGPIRVLLGDFNMRLGAQTGDSVTNKRGRGCLRS